MSLALINSAFSSTIMGGGLAIDIVWANKLYSVWGGASYTSSVGVYDQATSRQAIICQNFPAGVRPVTLAGKNEITGVYQVELRTPVVDDGFTHTAKLDAVRNLLHAGKKISYGGQDVNLLHDYFMADGEDNDWFSTVFRVNYLSFINR